MYLTRVHGRIHLLEPNKEYLVTIEVINGMVRYIVNRETFFEYKGSSVFKEGYFGFRSKNRDKPLTRLK